jgi:hypothetical protein
MFASDGVDEDERFGELPSFDQEASAVNFPFSGHFLHVPFLPRGGRDENRFLICECQIFDSEYLFFRQCRRRFLLAEFFVEVMTNLRVREGAVNPTSFVQCKKKIGN